MKKNSLRGLFAAVAVVATCSVAYADPAETIVLASYYSEFQTLAEGDILFSTEIDWSEAVNVNTEIEFTLEDADWTTVTRGKFLPVENDGVPLASITTTIQFEDPIDAPGTYTLTIPAGSVYNRETLEASTATNGPITITFVIPDSNQGEDNYVYTLDSAIPADGSDLESISTIITKWNGPVEVAGLGSGKVRLSKASGELLQVVDLTFGDDSETYIATFEEVTDPGQYMVIIPAGIITNEANGKNVEVILNYSIGGAGEVVDALKLESADPADGSVVTELSTITTIWNAAVVTTDFKHTAIVKNEAGEPVAVGNIGYDDNDMGTLNKIMIYIESAIVVPGTYTVTIPVGAVEANEGALKNSEIVLTYTVEGGSVTPPGEITTVYDFNPTSVYPESGSVVDENNTQGQSTLSPINLTFTSLPFVKEGYEFVFVNVTTGEKYPSVVKINEEPENFRISSLDGDMIILGLENVPSGKYELEVPSGVIGNEEWAKSGYTAGNANEAFYYYWEYTAKETVEVPDDVRNAELKLTLATITLPGGETVNLLDNASLAEIPAGAVFNLKTNKDDYAQSLYLNLKDENTGEILWTLGTLVSKDPTIPSIGIKNEEGVFQFEKANTETLYAGTTYSLVVKAFVNYEVPDSERIDLGETEVTFEGLTAGVELSDVEIEGITPEPGTVFESYDAGRFTVTYSDPVEIVTEGEVKTGYTVAFEGVAPFESITSNDTKTEWTFVIPQSELENSHGGDIICLVAANDMEGRRVYPYLYEYNLGGTLCQEYVYNCYLGCPKVTVIPGGGVVKSLNTFEFTCPEASKQSIAVQGIDKEGEVSDVYVANDKDEVVAVLDRKDYISIDNHGNVVDYNNPEVGQDEAVVKLIMHLDKEITEAGEYHLVIPAAFFMTGTEYDAIPNKGDTIYYTVDPTSGVESIIGDAVSVAAIDGKIVVNGAEGVVAIYAANGAKVASVASENGNAVVALEKGIYVVVANGKSIKVVL